MKKDTITSLRAKCGNLIEQGIASVFTRLRNDGLVLLLLLLFAAPLTLQIFQPGFFVGDDGEWMIIRSSAFHEALRDGQIPVRFLGRLNHEFGYPVATFLYPGYLYLTEPFIILGFGFIDAIKIMFTLTMVFSGFFAYFWLSKLFDKWSSLIGSLVYLYTPYHLVDMYIRGSLGELLALALVPFILWNIERKSLFFSAVGLAGLVLSHNIMAALFLPIILIYAFLRNTATLKARIVSLATLLLFSLGLSAFFWIPALFELSYTVFNQTKISEWQNYFAPFARIGGLQITLIITAGVILIFRKQLADKKSLLKIKSHVSLLVFFTILGLLAIFFSSSLSAPMWHILPVTFIQFPFRFLSVEIVACAFISAYVIHSITHSTFRSVYICIIAIALGINAMPYFTNIPSFDKGEGFYTTNQSTTTTRDEYMPVWVKDKPVQRVEQKVQIIQGKGEISNIVLNNKTIAFRIETESGATIQINKVYWPGWKASLDGKDREIDYKNSKGLMIVSSPEGEHQITLSFQETPLRLFSDVISGLSLFGLVLFVVFNKNIKKLYSY